MLLTPPLNGAILLLPHLWCKGTKVPAGSTPCLLSDGIGIYAALYLPSRVLFVDWRGLGFAREQGSDHAQGLDFPPYPLKIIFFLL